MSASKNFDATSGTSSRVVVPPGLRPLLEALAREIMRNQPADLYAFTRLFSDTLLKTKTECGGHDPIARPELYEQFKKNLTQEALKKGLRSKEASPPFGNFPNPSESKKYVLSISLTPDQAATKIQATARGFLTRRRVIRRRPTLEASRASRLCDKDAYNPCHEGDGGQRRVVSTPPRSSLARDNFDVTASKWTPDQAATKIEAAARGFLVRRKYSPAIQQRLANRQWPSSDRSPQPLPIIDEKSAFIFEPKAMIAATTPTPKNSEVYVKNEPVIQLNDVDMCASKIQAGIRGFLTRKHLSEKGLPVHAPSEFYRSRSHSPCVIKGQVSTSFTDVAYSAVSASTAAQPVLKGLKKSKKGSHSYDDILDAIGDRQLMADNAAAKIQAGIRGYLTRKHLSQKGHPVHTPSDFRFTRQVSKLDDASILEIGETKM